VCRLTCVELGGDIAVLSPVRGSSAGNYTLRWSHQNSFVHSEELAINPPVAYGTLFIRILVRNNGTDLAKVEQIMAQSSMTKAKS
jgi:hypothetical protein